MKNNGKSKRVDKLKDLKLHNRVRLWRANDSEDYTPHLILPETGYALLHHLFGLSYANKIFGLLKAWNLSSKRSSNKLLSILLPIRDKLRGNSKKRIKRTVIPKTSYQHNFINIKKKVINGITNIEKSIKGIPGTKVHTVRRLRKLSRRTKWGEFFTDRAKKGLKYQH